jgi:hypothetical protein
MSAANRRGTALILILAVLTLLGVLAFSLVSFVSVQEGWARAKHVESLLKTGVLSGRAHALMVLDDTYLAAKPTTPDGSQAVAFAPPTGTPAWPVDADAATRNANRATWIAQAAATATCDLWRFEPGLASPAVNRPTGTPPVPSLVDGWVDGYCSVPGTGRWTTIAWLDRNLAPTTRNKAGLQLRYAVSVIDLGGLILANKARYQHVVPTGAPSRLVAAYDQVDGADTWAGYPTPLMNTVAKTPRTLLTRSWDQVPVAGDPCPVTDRSLGITDDVNGYDVVRYNTWRPIPADHSRSANALINHGFGMDDSRAWTAMDAYTKITDVGQDRYVRRTGGNVPDNYRSQGAYQVSFLSWQFSRIFSDFLPFDQNPHPDSGTIATANKGQPSDAGNRHPQALLVRIQSDTVGVHDPSYGGFVVDPYDNPVGSWDRDFADMMHQSEIGNWWAIESRLRLSGSTGAKQAAVQCWTPFGSPIGWFDDLTPAVTRKNDAEMRYQWAVNANTAPKAVLEALVRLAIPEIGTSGDPTGWCSPESISAADVKTYNDTVRTKAANLWTGLRAASAQSVAHIDARLGAVGTGADQTRELRTLCRGGTPGGVGPTWPNGTLGAGPRAEFRIAGDTGALATALTDPDPAKRFLVVYGRHLNRFCKSGVTGTKPEAGFCFRLADGDGSFPDQGRLYRVARAEYVRPDPATTWAQDDNGIYTRIYIQPPIAASGAGLPDPSWLPTQDIAKADPDKARLVVIDYPGITLAVGTSRWFRVVVRAELYDLDLAASSKDLSLEFVYHIDPDRSAPTGGPGTLWDGDIPYSDYENSRIDRSGVRW